MSVEALVVGGGFAGMLTVRALLGHVDRITLIERDAYPEQPEFRAGVPQARHLHNLVDGGRRALENLLPGIGAEVVNAGAQRLVPSRDLLIRSTAGWHRRFGFTSCATVSCSRPLLDHVIRNRVMAEAGASRTVLEVLEHTEVTGLLGASGRITGVRLRQRGGRNPERELAGELVVDASGRGSRAPRWLGELGLPAPAEEQVDAQVCYATRTFQMSEGGAEPMYVQNEPKHPVGGYLLPVEGGKWMVTLSGFAGFRPSTDDRTFLDDIGKLAHPYMHRLVTAAEPVSPVYGFLDTSNRRRHYHARGALPEGLIVLGDAACVFNPVYGQGMAVAGLQAIALRDMLVRRGLRDDFSHAAQRALARVAAGPWRAATSADRPYLTNGAPLRMTDRLTDWFVNRLLEHTAANERVAEVVHRVYELSLPPVRLLSPTVLLPVLLLRPGPGEPEPPGPLADTRPC